MFSKKVNSLGELKDAAQALSEYFANERVFAFYGNMGAGKTTFIQSFCQVLGSEDNVTSPTFALINEYNTLEFDPIYHFDFYRINDIEEAFDMGYEDYVYSGNYCLIEWPQMIEPLLPENYVEVKIEVKEDDSRLITAQTV